MHAVTSGWGDLLGYQVTMLVAKISPHRAWFNPTLGCGCQLSPSSSATSLAVKNTFATRRGGQGRAQGRGGEGRGRKGGVREERAEEGRGGKGYYACRQCGSSRKCNSWKFRGQPSSEGASSLECIV